jgi:hypothetical protein
MILIRCFATSENAPSLIAWSMVSLRPVRPHKAQCGPANIKVQNKVQKQNWRSLIASNFLIYLVRMKGLEPSLLLQN